MDIMLAPEVRTFVLCVAAMTCLLLFELICATIIGAGPSSLLEGLVDFDGTAHPALNWLLMREVPLMVVIGNAVAIYGAGGLAAQLGFRMVTDAWLPAWSGHTAAAAAATLGHAAFSACVRRFRLFHTTAVSSDSFIGQPFLLISDTAEEGSPGEAKWVDEYQQAHYVMLSPAQPGVVFRRGDVVYPTARDGASFIAERAE